MLQYMPRGIGIGVILNLGGGEGGKPVVCPPPLHVQVAQYICEKAMRARESDRRRSFNSFRKICDRTRTSIIQSKGASRR